jgi:hypothetical protein
MTAYSTSRPTTVGDPEALETLETREDRLRRQILRWSLVIVLVIAGILLYWLSERELINSMFFPGYLAFILGGFVGAGELMARYRDAPFGSLVRNPSFVYIGVNALAATVAFFLINVFGWTFQDVAPESPAAATALQVLVAGFGAMALFRSSLFIARIGEQEVGIGPSIVLQTVLNAADAGVDRESAKARAPAVEKIMRGVDANKAKDILPLFCYRLLQSSLPEGEYNVMKSKVDDIFSGKKESIAVGPEDQQVVEVAANSKAYLVGLILMNYMGADVLGVGVKTLGSEIKKPPKLYVEDITKEISDDEVQEEAVVDYHVSAEDAEGNPIQPSCNPPSGTKFPVGQTTIVSCEATDNTTGLKARESFKVELLNKKAEIQEAQQQGLEEVAPIGE